jgi:hypothetical protein
MSADQTAPQSQTLLRGSLIVAAVAGLLSLAGAAVNPDRFMQAYLAAYLLWAGVAIASLGLVMLNQLVSGRWMYVIQRFAEAATRTLPLLLVFFIPIIFGLETIYPWAGEGGTAELSGGKVWLLQPAFFVLRTVIYLAVLIGLGYFFTRRSYENDSRDSVPTERSDHTRNVAAVGMVFYMLITTFAAFDWSMTLVPEWFSGMYGWLALSRWGLTLMALLIIALAFVWEREPFNTLLKGQTIKDFGSILMVTLLLWLYMQALQFIIIWQGNVTYYVMWYDIHAEGSWSTFITIFAILHGIILLLMMTPGLKNQRSTLLAFAIGLFVLRALEMFWVVLPVFNEGVNVTVWDIGPVLALGGLWIAVFAWVLAQHDLLPRHHSTLDDPHVAREREQYGTA